MYRADVKARKVSALVASAKRRSRLRRPTSRAGLVPVEGRHARARCSSPTARASQRDGTEPDAPHRLRRLQRQHDARLQRDRGARGSSAGGVFAVPNLRGGGEFGEDWHRAGMLDKKQNVFDDFIAAAEWLIANGYTQPEPPRHQRRQQRRPAGRRRRSPSGPSCSAPCSATCRCSTCSATTASPSAQLLGPRVRLGEDPEQFKSLYAYSPYHHVKAGTAYPAIFFTTGDADTRVAPLHARKMTARLQAATTSGRPVLLSTTPRPATPAGGRSARSWTTSRCSSRSWPENWE